MWAKGKKEGDPLFSEGENTGQNAQDTRDVRAPTNKDRTAWNKVLAESPAKKVTKTLDLEGPGNHGVPFSTCDLLCFIQPV